MNNIFCFCVVFIVLCGCSSSNERDNNSTSSGIQDCWVNINELANRDVYSLERKQHGQSEISFEDSYFKQSFTIINTLNKDGIEILAKIYFGREKIMDVQKGSIHSDIKIINIYGLESEGKIVYMIEFSWNLITLRDSFFMLFFKDNLNNKNIDYLGEIQPLDLNPNFVFFWGKDVVYLTNYNAYYNQFDKDTTYKINLQKLADRDEFLIDNFFFRKKGATYLINKCEFDL